MQELSFGFVQGTDPVTVRVVGDTEDVPIEVKCTTYTPVIGEKVLLGKSGSDDGWVIVCGLGAATDPGEQHGKANGTTDGSGEFTVTFDTPFDVAPEVTLTPSTGGWRSAVVRSVTTTEFTGAVYYETGGAITLLPTGTYTVYWVARPTAD